MYKNHITDTIKYSIFIKHFDPFILWLYNFEDGPIYESHLAYLKNDHKGG